MKKIRTLSFSLLLPALLLANGCSGDVKAKLGMRRDGPDEFQVIAAPPLSVPPEFNLRPPLNAAGITRSTSAQQDAKKMLINNGAAPTPDVRASALPSSGDEKFITKAGASTTDTSIREIMSNESQPAAVQEEKKGFFSSLLTFNKEDDAPITVDAAAEKQRIDTNKQTNQPITAGETPTINQKKSVIEKLLDSE
jgi:hypothetical protein